MSVNAGQVKIQGVATCTFLCMDSCGFLYSTREFGDECVFNEILEQSYQNMYTSVRYSNSKRTLYLAIGKGGIPRKLQVNANHTLGKKSTYVEVLPQLIKPEQIEQLENRLLAMYPNVPHHSLRHHQLCPPSIHTKLTMSHQCRKQPKKRKKRKGNDKGEDEDSSAAQDPKVPSGGTKKNDKEGDHSTKKGKKRRVEKKKTPKSQASKSPDRGNIMEDDETTTEFLDDEK